MSVINLPRLVRYLQENTILVGIIPGRKEPKLTVNGLLELLVDDLIVLWEGVILKYKDAGVLVRAALRLSGCEIPAARKTCGFVGHGARVGVSKCTLEFCTHHFGEKPDNSNFNRQEWIPRNNHSHRLNVSEHRLARMCIIDPMHNLFLGTVKTSAQ